MSFFVEVVENGAVGEVDSLTVRICSSEGDKVADFAFEANVSDEALASFDIEAWEVSCIGITIWIGGEVVPGRGIGFGCGGRCGE